MPPRRSPIKTPFVYASPWILIASIAMLLMIVILFAVNNVQREKKIMTESLFNKGQAIIRFVGAGTRASMMMGDRNLQQIQHLIEQAAGESNIVFITVVDDRGTILAHSSPDKVGERLDHPLLTDIPLPPIGRYRIINPENGGKKTFEVIANFAPLRHGRGQFWKRHMQMMGKDPAPAKNNGGNREWCPLPANGQGWPSRDNIYILVSLDMTEQEAALRQARNHMFFMSIATLLVGLGCWIALLTAQGYRTSQQTLQQMQAFTDLLISRLPIGIIATNQKGRIQTCNRTASLLADVAPTDILGRYPQEVLPQSIRPFFLPESQNQEIIDQEITLQSTDGQKINIRLGSVAITDQKGENIGRVVLMHDISQIKKLEEQVLRHDRLVSLGKMAAGVAHEVRNPLSSIKGFATLLGSRFTEESEEKEAAGLLIREVERLNRSITELLNYARPLPLSPETIMLKDFLQNSIKLIAGDAQELGITIDCRCSDDTLTATVDRDRLKQVMLNLFLNSMQAMEDGGQLTVTVEPGQDAATTAISVTDTGGGIAEEIMGRVMDPYFTTKPEGTGLGLAMVHKIIDEHGGSVRIKSSKGQGTTVTVTLPA